MSDNKHPISEQAAVELLKRIFPDAPNTTELTVEEVFKIAGREGKKARTNRNWLNLVLSKLKSYGFVATTTRFQNSRIRLHKIKLTLAGKTALSVSKAPAYLASIAPPPMPTFAPVQEALIPVEPSKTKLTLEELLLAIDQIRASSPNWDIVFEVKTKTTGGN